MGIKLFGENQPAAWQDKTGTNTIAANAGDNPFAPEMDENAEPGKVSLVHTPHQQFSIGQTDFKVELDQGAEAAMLMDANKDINRFFIDEPRMKCKQYLDGLGDTSQMDDATLKGHANAMMDYILGGLSDRAFGESTPKMTGAELFKRMSEYANGSADALKSPEQQAFEAMTPEEKVAEVERANKGKMGYLFRRNRANEAILTEYEKTLKPEELADFQSIMRDSRKFREDPELVKRTEGTRKAYYDLVNADTIKQHQDELEQKSIINTLASKTFRWLSDDAKKFVTAHLNGDDFNWEMFNTKVRPEEQDAVLAALHLARGEKEINGVFGLRPGGVEGLRKALPTDKQDDVTRVLYGATQGFWSRIGSEVWHGGKNLVKEWIVYPWYSEAERKKAYANLELESKVRDAMDRPWKDPESFAGKLIASYGDNFGFQMIGGFGAKGAQIATRGAEAAKMGKATGLFGWLGSRAAKAKEGVKAAEALTGASEGAKAQVALLKAHDAARKAYQAADKAVEAAKDALEMARAGKGKLTADAALKALDGALSTRAAASEKSIQTFRKINGGINATREAIEGAEFYNKILAAQKAAAAATRTIDRTASVIKGAAYTGENALWFVPFYDQQVRRDVANGIPIEVSLKTRWVTMLACGWAEKAVFTKMGQSNLTPQMLTATSNRAIKEAGVRVGKDIWNKVQGDVAATLGRDFKALEMAIANRIKGDVLHGAGTAINVTAQSMLDEVLNKMGEVYERNAQIHGFISKEAFLAPFGDGKMLEWTQTCLDVLDNSEFSAPAFAVLSPIGMRSGYRRRAASEREYQRRMGNTTGLPWENANINTDAGLVAAKNNLDGAVIAATKYLAGEAQKREQMIQQQGVEVPADYRGEDKQKQKTISDRLNGIIAKVFEIGADTKGKRSVERIMDECKVDRPTAELLLGVANDYAALDGPLQDAKRMYYDFLRSWKIKSPKLVAKEILEGMIPGAKRVQMTDDGLKFDIEMGGENIEFGYRTMEKFTADDVAEMITDNSPVGIEYDTLPAEQKERGADGKIVPWKMLTKDRRTEIVVNHLSGLSSYGKGSGKFYMTEKDGTKRYIDVDELIQISGDGSYAGSPRHETAHSVLRVAERLGYFTQEDKRVVADVLGIDTESDAAKEIVDGGVPRWVVEVDEALAEGYREHTMGLSTPAWNRLAEGYDGASVIMKGIIAGANKVADYLTKSVATRPEWMPRSRNNVPVLDKFYDAMFRGDIENLRKMLPGTDEAKAPAAPAVSPELAAYNKAVEEYKFQKALAGSGNTNADVEGAKQRMNEAMNALRAANKKRREEKVAAMGPRASLMMGEEKRTTRLAPNGKRSNLTDRQYDQVRTPEFKAWFGDWENDPANASKVVDENGEPLVVYHRTDWNPMQEKQGEAAFNTPGVYFTSKIDETAYYGKNIVKAFLDIRNPRLYDIVTDEPIEEHKLDDYQELTSLYAPELAKRGFDGAMTLGVVDANEHWFFANNPEQIKSATDNTGAFDKTNRDIRASIVMTNDDKFLAAVNSGDNDTAMRMLREEAKRKMKDPILDKDGLPKVFFNGSPGGFAGSEVGRTMWFSTDRNVALGYTQGFSGKTNEKDVGVYFIDADDFYEYDANGAWWNQIDAFRVDGELFPSSEIDDLREEDYEAAHETNDIAEYARSQSYKGVIIKNVADGFDENHMTSEQDVVAVLPGRYGFVTDPSNITGIVKRADVTMDDNGNVIPLSQRYDRSKADVRASIFRAMGDNNKGYLGLDEAKTMLDDGSTMKDIWKATGWWRGEDGDWRFELKDFKQGESMKILSFIMNYGFNTHEYDHLKVGEIRRNTKIEALDAIAAVYPQFDNVEIFYVKHDSPDHRLPRDNTYGMQSWDSKGNPIIEIYPNFFKADPSETHSTIAHEIQHIIQVFEGIEAKSGAYRAHAIRDKRMKKIVGDIRNAYSEAHFGMKVSEQDVVYWAHSDYTKNANGTADWKTSAKEVSDALEKIAAKYGYASVDEMMTAAKKEASKVSSFADYQLDNVETESRLVEARMKMTEEQRKAESPWETAEKMLIAEGYDADQNQWGGRVNEQDRYTIKSEESVPEETGKADTAEINAVKVNAAAKVGASTRYCLVSGLEGSGLTYETDANGRLKIILPNGKKITEKTPATAEDLMQTDSMLMHLIDLGIKHGTIGSSQTEGNAFKRNIADAFAQCFNLAAKWGRTNEGISAVDTMWRWIADETFKAIKSNSDKQYGTSVDILTICKKTDMLMQVVSDYMKKQKRGAMPTDIMHLYDETGKGGFQTPCPVCYVFSRWIRAGYDRQTAYEAQNMYKDAIALHDPNTAAGKRWWKKEYKKYFIPDPKKQKLTDEQKARDAAITKAKETLILGYQKFDEAMRKGDRTTADQLNAEMADAFETIRTADIAGFIKYCIYDVDRDIVWNDFREVPTDILFDFREAVSIANDYPALKRFYGSKGSAGGKAIETEARNDLGDVVTGIATDGGIETYEKWTPEYEAQLLAQSQEKEPDPKNPGRMKKTNKANAATAKYNARNWLKVAYSFPAGSKERADALKKFDDQFTSALAKSIRQNLIGGQRFFSWSDNRVEFGFDMMMNLMQIQLLGDSIQSYSKQLEGAELLAKHGAYNNGSLMGAGNGLEEAKPGEPGAVEIGGKWMKLKFSDIQGINHTALFELNKQYDKSGNILVGMNDDHIRVALRDERVFFIIPWHASGLGTGLLDHMLTSLGEDAHGSETDYSSYQSEKFLAGATPDAEIVSLWDRAAKGGKKFKSCIEVTHKQGEVTKSQLDYRAMRQAILLGKASQEMIDAAMKDEFLSQIVLDLQRGAARLGPNADSTYVNKNLKVPMLKMAGAAVDAVYPYEYWDRGSTYGKASVNSARYLEYCRRLGVLPKFCGIMVEKGVAKRGTYGNFTDEANYWKLLIDRRMYANGRNKDGSFKDFASGKYQHTDQVQMATANRSFDIDTINPQAIERKWGKLVTKKANAAQVGSIVDKVIEKQKQQGYSLATRSVRASLGIPPGLSGAFKTDDLLAMAAAGRLAKSLSGRESVRQDIDRRVRAIYEGASESELNNRITAIMAKAEQDALEVDKDFKQDNRDAEVLNAMTRRQVERYMRSLEGAGKQGLAVGARSEAARQELDRRIERKIQDSVAAQTGIAVNELESSLGVDLAETMVRIHDIENQAAAQRKKDNPEADKDEAEVPPELAVPVTDEERAEAERIIRDMVDGIVGKAWQETEEEAKKREERKRKAAEAKSDADEDADGEDIADITGEERLAKFILEKYPVDLRNPEHFAKFIALLAERKWRTDHGLSRDEYIWGDPVALQHLRMTAVNVYDALARKLMYSSKRETAMESIGRIGEAPNYNSVVNEMSFAGKVIAQGMVRETANELVKDLEQFLTQGFGANGRFKQNEEDIHRKVTGRTELWARDVKKVLRWSPEKVANEIDKIRERMQGVDAEFLLAGRDPNSSKQFDKDLRMISALQEFGGMLHKPLGEITDARVKILDRLDADKVAEEAEARDQRTKEMSALLGKAFDSGRKMAFDQTKLSAKIGNYFQEHLDFKHLLQDLARFCKDADTKNATLEFIDNLQHDVQRRWDKARTEERVQMLGFQEAVCAIYGTKNYHKVIADLLKHDERFDKFGQGEVNEDTGVATMVKMSKASAMQLYVAMQQKGYIGNIKANHREGQAIEIRKLLTKEDLALLKWLGDWYDKERDGISEVSMRLFGLPVLAEESNYFPVKVMVPTQGLEKGAVGAWNPFPPSLTPRVKHGYDFDVRENIISMWTSRMTQQAQWKAMAELGIEMRGIFGRQSLQSTIRRCHGEQALKNVLSFITDILNGQSGIQSDSLAEKTTLDKMRSAAAICALGGNLGVMLKQTTSVPAFGLEIGIGHTLQHLSTAFTPDGLRAMGAIVSSDQFKNRWDMGNSEEVANAIREALTTRNAFQTKVGDPLKRLLKKSMVTNKMGDCVPSLLIGQGIYRSFVRQGLAAEEAMNRTWEIINRTQQTNQMDNKSMMQRRSKYGNLITQFQSCVRQYLAYEIAAVRQFAAQPTDLKNAASLARATFLTCGVLPSLYYLGGVLWGMILGQKPDDDFLDDWVKSVLISNTASLYGWGLMMDGIVSEAFFAKKGKEPIIPAMQIANSFVRGISRMGYDLFSMAPMMWGDNPDADLDDFVDDAIKWLKGLNAPVRDALKAKENYDL